MDEGAYALARRRVAHRPATAAVKVASRPGSAGEATVPPVGTWTVPDASTAKGAETVLDHSPRSTAVYAPGASDDGRTKDNATRPWSSA